MKTRHAVDADGEVFGVGDGVADFADAEGDVLRVGWWCCLASKLEVQLVEVLRAVAVGPPEARVFDVQGVVSLRRSKEMVWRACACELDGPLEGDVFNGAFEDAGLRLVGDVFDRGLDGDIGGVRAGQRQVRGDERVFDEHGAGGGEIDLLPDAGVAVANGGEPVPADGGEEGGAVERGDAAVLAEAVFQGVFMRHAGVGLRGDEHGDDGFLAGLDAVGDVELAADEGAAGGADFVRR